MQSLIFPVLIALLAVPLFLQMRKQKRAVQEQQKMQKSLTVGDRVMTTSGLYGTVVGLDDDSIELEIAPGITTSWLMAAVRERVKPETDEDDSDVEDDEIDSDETEAETDAETETEAGEAKKTEVKALDE